MSQIMDPPPPPPGGVGGLGLQFARKHLLSPHLRRNTAMTKCVGRKVVQNVTEEKHIEVRDFGN